MAKHGWGNDKGSFGLGGVAIGANPTDRGKRGPSAGSPSDGRGMPLAVVVDGVNRNDMSIGRGHLGSYHDHATYAHRGEAAAHVPGRWL
jgi:hypothetical protein